MSMTSHDLNAWVAEHVMGWEYRENPHGWRLWFPLGKDKIQQTVGDDDLPGYCTDLNACAKAETKIGEMGIDMGQLWARHVIGVLYEHRPPPSSFRASWVMTFQIATATARQRCEAMYAMRDEIASGTVADEPAQADNGDDNDVERDR